jgi:hypothetical protein
MAETSIYRKLAQARLAFQRLGVRMSGQNSFAGYAYYELSDILPVVNSIGAELGFLCEVSFTDTLATLIVRDVDKPSDVVIFTSPMSEASLKGCHAVQNLGAVETYIKRYLYQNAFEIVEADSLNKTHNPEQKTESKPERKPESKPEQKADHPTSQEQATSLSDRLGLTKEERGKLWKESGENWSNLLIMLKAKEKEAQDRLAGIDKTLADVFSSQK